MRKILLAAVAVTPLFAGAAFANIAHSNTDAGQSGGQEVLYIGNQAEVMHAPHTAFVNAEQRGLQEPGVGVQRSAQAPQG